MARMASSSWSALFAVAETQQGLFTAEQAREAGLSPQSIDRASEAGSGRIARVRRGIYRFVQYPAADRYQEDLVVLWLWSEQTAVFSHETALVLHDLSDALPALVHLTVPASWVGRRIQVPDNVAMHYSDVSPQDKWWCGAVPVTSPRRTICDVALALGSWETVDLSVRQAIRRGLASPAELAPAVVYLAKQAGLPTEATS